MTITNITVYYRDKKNEKTEHIASAPDSEDLTDVKVQVGKMIKKISKHAMYYYVVVEVEKNNGKPGYRTIIPKTVVG